MELRPNLENKTIKLLEEVTGEILGLDSVSQTCFHC